jgi:acetate kinase
MQLLIFNAGSSSLKFELLAVEAGEAPRRVASGSFVDAADGTGRFVPRMAAPPTVAASTVAPPTVATLAQAAETALQWLSDRQVHGRDLMSGVAASVHRIVHGGERFRATTVLGEADLAALAELNALAPLHNPPALAVITAVRRKLGAAVPLVGVFDTAFYAQLPEAAIHYAIPARWRDDYGIRRYGFHGMAHRYLSQAVRGRLPPSAAPARVVSVQLGQGCSVTATLEGRAIATSMGFTPLEGLVMGTRSGDLDPGALLYVMERSGMSPADARRLLNQESGLLGLSGKTADMHELLSLEHSGDAAAALAVEVFCRRARHYVAASIAELGGTDAIVFGGGIGENSPEIRQRIVGGLHWAGIALQPQANAASVGVDAKISAEQSRAAVWVTPVDEANIMATEAVAVLG